MTFYQLMLRNAVNANKYHIFSKIIQDIIVFFINMKLFKILCVIHNADNACGESSIQIGSQIYTQNWRLNSHLIPFSSVGSCRVSNQGTTLHGSDLHRALAAILNPFI